jgi:hypothetical protein
MLFVVVVILFLLRKLLDRSEDFQFLRARSSSGFVAGGAT